MLTFWDSHCQVSGRVRRSRIKKSESYRKTLHQCNSGHWLLLKNSANRLEGLFFEIAPVKSLAECVDCGWKKIFSQSYKKTLLICNSGRWLLLNNSAKKLECLVLEIRPKLEARMLGFEDTTHQASGRVCRLRVKKYIFQVVKKEALHMLFGALITFE